MGTIINDFFYQNGYENDFDKLLNEHILSDVEGKNIISDYYYVEELFTEIASDLIDYVKIDKEFVKKDEKINMSDMNVDLIKDEIDTLDTVLIRLSELNRLSETNKYRNLIKMIKDARNNRTNSINRNSEYFSELSISHAKLQQILTIKSGKIIEKYNRLNDKVDELYNNDQPIEIKNKHISPLRLDLSVKLIDSDTRDYYMYEINLALKEEISYLNTIYDAVQLVSNPNIDYNDLSNLEEVLDNMSKIKEVLAIKKELLRDMYFKLINTNAYDYEMNLDSISQETCLLDSATDYLEYMLHGTVKEGSKYEYPLNRRYVSDETGKDINRRLNNVYLSHISPIRVVK